MTFTKWSHYHGYDTFILNAKEKEEEEEKSC